MNKINLLVLTAILTMATWTTTALAADYNLAQVTAHNTASDCWTIVGSNVYNLTSYITSHPGGAAAITTICGVSGTTAFTTQHGSQANAQSALATLLIGNLVSTDNTAPSIPTNLLATTFSSNQINLTWTIATDNTAVTGYNIYRNNLLIANSPTNSYNNVGLLPSTSYTYTVSAYDAANNQSGQSISATATTTATSTDTTVPSTPTNLVVKANSATQISLNWSAATDNVAVTGYKVFRDNVLLANTLSNNYINTGLTPNTSYVYTVSAFDAKGNTSLPSSSSSTTTLATSTDILAPLTPTRLKAVTISNTAIKLSWVNSTDNVGVTGYNIFRNSNLIATTAGNSFTDSGLSPKTRYSYHVVAFDGAGNNSAISNTALATTNNVNAINPPKYSCDKFNIRSKKFKECKKEYQKKLHEYQKKLLEQKKQEAERLREQRKHADEILREKTKRELEALKERTKKALEESRQERFDNNKNRIEIIKNSNSSSNKNRGNSGKHNQSDDDDDDEDDD